MSADPKSVIAARAAKELRPGEIVNLGIGIPNLIPGFLGNDTAIFLHTENGLLGVGPRPAEDELDPDLVDAAKRPITALPGASYFDSASSFAMIRGGHVDVAMLGAMEVAQNGDLANWSVPGEKVTGMGGAMDLVSGAKRVVVTMEHAAKDGSPKILEHCSLPLTGRRCVNLIVTELAVIEVVKEGLLLTEIAPDTNLEAVKQATGTELLMAKELKVMS